MKIKLGISLYRIFSRAYFYLPFLLIYLYQKGYSIITIEYLMACYGIGAFLTNKFVKTKLIIVQSKILLIVSECLKIIGLIALMIGSNTFYIICAQMILGISYAIGAGEDTILINEYINDDPSDFQNKSNSYMFLSLLISGIIGGNLYNISNVLPMLLTNIAAVLSIVCVIFLVPNNQKKRLKVEGTKVIRHNLSFKEKSLIIHYAMIRGIILSMFTGFLPYYLFKDMGISTQKFIFILAAYTLMGMIASKKLSTLPIQSSFIALVISLLLLSSKSIVLIVLGMIFLGLSSGLTRPQTINNLKTLGGDLSQTLGLAELIYSIINFGFLIAGGYVFSFYQFRGILLMATFVLVIYLVIEVYLRRNSNEN